MTVYPGQARITRRGTVSAAAGEQRVRLGGLPLGLRPDSVRVNGRGPATVLGVDVLAEHHPRSPDATVDELEKRRETLQGRLAELDDEATVLGAREQLIESLVRRAAAAFARTLTESGDTDRVAATGDALAAQLAAVLAARRELADRRRDVQLELDAVGRRLHELLAQQTPDRLAVAVDLDMARDGEIELEISYLVDSARWESRYDVRLHDEQLTLTWFGLITQHSGEDWPECDLRLSTARPASAVTVPELDPWYLDRHEVTVYRTRSMDAVAGAPMPAAPGMALAQAAPERAAVATATVEQGVTAAVYTPARRIAVPSDGSPHRTTVTVAELSARLDHVTVPLKGPEAYLRATAVNSSEHTLRPGPAAIFHETEFVGTTRLEPWAPGEEVELALGVDDRVRVERELVRRAAGKAVLGGTRRHEAAYRITVGNYGPRRANVTVVDQIPVSRDDAIVVREVQLDPKPAEQSDLGEVTWKLELDPGATAELTLGFRVDVAKGVRLAGWSE
ncbi:mucoidy inhibitor MuiA family protein [Actinophytocola sp.]|uniref:mucoidy inhibitor MuiA family protein n=1 Tax=Actinophytocola sp. TaxID=1872138 RepID=UPI002D80C505|nr:mucoidy inhibitor MuiA family protein [Actinophytocola sp.]HET9140193.1 mucoidy inhibitor MuiA family protein [Actinophytocola sp.]